MIEDVFIPTLIGLIFAVWPFIYVSLKRGVNKLLYVCACMGLVVLTFILLTVFAFPFGIFLIKIAPSLSVQGLVENLGVVFSIYSFIADWHAVVIYPLIYLLSPMLIYRRYAIFRDETREPDDRI